MSTIWLRWLRLEPSGRWTEPCSRSLSSELAAAEPSRTEWYSYHLTRLNSNLIQVDVVVLSSVAAYPCTKNITFLRGNDGLVLKRLFAYLPRHMLAHKQHHWQDCGLEFKLHNTVHESEISTLTNCGVTQQTHCTFSVKLCSLRAICILELMFLSFIFYLYLTEFKAQNLCFC